MSKIYDFKEQLKLGQLGEKQVSSYLNGLVSTVDVIDLSKVKRFQRYGIDGQLVYEGENGLLQSEYFDVKTEFNFHRTGKIFIEISADTNKEGGILSTKASVFYYYNPYGGELFKIYIQNIRNWYERAGIAVEQKTVKNNLGMEASGIIVSIDFLLNEGVIVEEYNIGNIKF